MTTALLAYNHVNQFHEEGKQPNMSVNPDEVVAMGDYETHTGEWKYWEKEWLTLSEGVEVIDVLL